MSKTARTQAPTANVVFILGITPRSGTNFLHDLLLLHPDCTRARPPVWEDFLVNQSKILISYADSVASHWPAKWGVPSDVKREMLKSLGDGLLSFLRADASARTVIAKTPSVIGIENFFFLFPKSPLIVLVRDGRAVTESAMRSFGWSFEQAIHTWRNGAERILAFDRRFRPTHGNYYRIVRYEDLYSNLRPTLAPLLDFCGLNSARFDYDAAEKIPVRGSSVYGTVNIQGISKLQWNRSVARSTSFNPINRWQQWDASRRERFAWLTAGYMRTLGYECQNADIISPVSLVRHHISDILYLIQRVARGGWRRLQQRANRL